MCQMRYHPWLSVLIVVEVTTKLLSATLKMQPVENVVEKAI